MDAITDFRKATVSLEQVVRLIEEREAYAIFDSVGVPSVPKKMLALAAGRACSLFLGTPFESYTAVAPYLVSLDLELLGWIRSELWKDPWGILVFSRLQLNELFQHFRRFLIARMPDGKSAFFRFQDPRILPAFLESSESTTLGFWNGIAAYGWGEDESVAMVKRPAGAAKNQSNSPFGEVAFSIELMRCFGKAQLQNFIERSIEYFDACGVALPANRDAFFQSTIVYANSVGIRLELDSLRFMHLVLGWHGMKSIAAVREILTYPGVPGTDKVDLLCEMAAFSVTGPANPQVAGLDLEANAKASKRFLDDHLNDQRFLVAHPGGALTLDPADTLLRKEWLRIYNEEVANRAKVTRAPVGSAWI